ncbi:MAG TPA: serine hydrolase domain-containing protein [Pyrinomonadaceae bacterium]|nr:serine hydrolase domain-containing protein [Pyrinomonadaceae bacterium]
MKCLYILLVIALLLCHLPIAKTRAQVAPTSSSQTSDKYADKLRSFEEFVRQQMLKNKIPGLTIGFVKDDYIWVKGFGSADLENKVPAKADSAYRFASIQKSMTAVAVLQLVEQGKINLDAEIQTYVPYFPKKKYPITVRQLLGHLGGIPHYVNRDAEQHIKEHKTTREAIAIFENYDLVAEPGTKFSYSSYGYNLLGAAIEGASKQSYADYMREHVWQPVGMNDTRMDDPLDIIPNRVRGYQIINGVIKNSEFIDVSSRFAAGGTRGTVVDLLRFMKGLNDEKLLTRESLDLMYTPMKTRDGKFSGFPRTDGYAMGWNVVPQKSGLVVVNDGGQQETRTFILNFPSKHFAIAVAQNLEKDDDGAIIFRLYELTLDEKFSLVGQ